MHRAVGLGASWGFLCGIANGGPVASTLAQMAVPWIWVAALVGYRLATSPKAATLLGAVSLVVANLTYLAVGVVWGLFSASAAGGNARFFALWTGVGLVIGPIAATIGWWLTVDRRRWAAVVLLSTVSVAEPLALWAHIDHLDAHIGYLGVAIAGLVLLFVLHRREWRKTLRAFLLTVALTYPAAVVLEASLIALGQISSPMRLI